MPRRTDYKNTSSYPLASTMKRVIQLFRESLDESLRPHGITAAQLHVLKSLEQEPGISGARLARACMVTPQTTQVLLRGIEANGWIARSKDPENDRILLASLTPTGKRMLAKCRTAVGQIYARMLHGFAEEDIHCLERLLSDCAANLAASSPAQGKDGLCIDDAIAARRADKPHALPAR